MGLMEKAHSCELCRKQATLYCEADSAYVCGECDRKVHGANFLVARHARNVLCCRCYQRSEKCVWGGCPVLPAQSLCGLCSAPSECNEQISLCISTAESVIPGHPASGDSSCPGCSDGECEESRREIEEVGSHCGPASALHAEGQRRIIGEEEADSNLQFCCREGGAIDSPVFEVSIDGWSYGEEGSSSLISQKIPKNFSGTHQEIPREDTGLSNQRRRGVVQNAEMKVETILRKWYRHLNLRSPSTVPLAMHLMEKSLCKVCPAPVVDRQKVRISLAASLWLAATLCENATQLPPVKKLQECTGIPSKLIVWSGSRLSKLLNWMRQEEGWAECST